MKKYLTILLCTVIAADGFSQVSDSIRLKELQDIIIRSWLRRDIQRMPAEQNGYLNSGKKNELITLSGTNANISLKTGRQLFAKVPGVFVYDMDGSGNQLNISTRGLDAHRSWEINSRQNGIIINSDMYGYPASHYSAPLESFEKIEIVRGAGSLQYGAQFGGMVNYVTKKPDSTKAFGVETSITAGSWKMRSAYTAVSGTIKKFSYYGYYYGRNADGYRKNGRSESSAGLLQLQYRFSSRLSITASLGRSTYLYQLPGPLTDSMFAADPRSATRSRNYFKPDIYIPSLVADWKISAATSVKFTASAVYGSRSSVMLDAFANVPDTIDAVTNQFKNRQVDIDNFHSRTGEIRLLHSYSLGNRKATMAAGVVYMNNDLHRRQLGKGTTGSDFDLHLVTPGFGRDMHFRTKNVGLFMEQLLPITNRWSISPGLRWEKGSSAMGGIISYYPADSLPNKISHNFLLAGISSRFGLNDDNEIYGGYSQAFRPVIFKDIVPGSVFEKIDKNLADARGYNADLGIRGRAFRTLQYDVSVFTLLYRNRMGTLALQDANGNPYTLKTNTGTSRTTGVEFFLQYRFRLKGKLYAGLFTSTSWMNAAYTEGNISDGTSNKSLKGNRVESVPEWITRSGLELLYGAFSCTFLHNYTSSTYSDALNMVIPPASGARGLTPGYVVWDWNASYKPASFYSIRVGISNIFDKQYFTKRPAFYPGPGIWPSDGRNGYVTLVIRI